MPSTSAKREVLSASALQVSSGMSPEVVSRNAAASTIHDDNRADIQRRARIQAFHGPSKLARSCFVHLISWASVRHVEKFAAMGATTRMIDGFANMGKVLAR